MGELSHLDLLVAEDRRDPLLPDPVDDLVRVRPLAHEVAAAEDSVHGVRRDVRRGWVERLITLGLRLGPL